MAISKNDVMRFVRDHKTELFLGSIFTAGVIVGHCMKPSYKRASKVIIDETLGWGLRYPSVKDKKAGILYDIYFGRNANDKHAIHFLGNKEDAEVIKEYITEALEREV